MDFEKHLQSVPNELFAGRNDATDPRLGEIVQRGHKGYETADVVIVGCPQDEGVRRNQGRIGAAQAPSEIRRALYKFPYREDLIKLSLCDLGDTRVSKSLEETHEHHESLVRQVLSDGKRVIVLGGGNDISYPDLRALTAVHKNFFAINIDSHFDVRESDFRHSGTPYRQLLDEQILSAKNFIETAQKPETVPLSHFEYLSNKGVRIAWFDQLREHGVGTAFNETLSQTKADAIFWGIDMDSVRAADAPGVSAPYPIGLTADDMCEIGAIAGSDPRSTVLEITEVNPVYDVDNRTARLAAFLILKFLHGLSYRG